MSGGLTVVVSAATCGAIVTAAEPLTIRLLRRAAVLDLPNQRSSHAVPTPRGGGVPIAIGLATAAMLSRGGPWLTFAVAVLAFAAVGFADDLASLPVARRLVMQGLFGLVISAVMVSGAGLGPGTAVVATVITAIWLIGFVNVFNFMDGINGISGAHALIGGAAFACLGALRHDPFLTGAGAAVAAGGLAFLPWNAGRARVFLGDSGSYGIGVALAVLAAHAVLHGVSPEAAVGPLALYLADTSWTLQRRIRAHGIVHRPHRTHVYQRLCDAGWSHQRITAVTGSITAGLSLLGGASLTQYPPLRLSADLVMAFVLASYLRSPRLLDRPAVLAGID